MLTHIAGRIWQAIWQASADDVTIRNGDGLHEDCGSTRLAKRS